VTRSAKADRPNAGTRKLRQMFHFTGGVTLDELCDGNCYTEFDRELCELDCRLVNQCQQGNVPKSITVEDASLFLV